MSSCGSAPGATFRLCAKPEKRFSPPLKDHMASLLARRPVALSFEIAEIHPDLNFKAGTIRDHMKGRAESAEAAE